jgi:hypothetical protein
MFKKLMRQVLLLAAAIGMAVLPFGQPVTASAATTGTLFALSQATVYKVDPASAALTLFAALPLRPNSSPFESFGGLVSDPVGHRLFTNRFAYSADFSTAFYNLITVDSQSAAVTVGPDMASGITGMVYDPSSGSLFGQTNMCCPFQFVRIDPLTGVQTHVADIPGVQPLGMVDVPSRHSVYFATESFVIGQFQPVITLVAIDTSSGAISQTPLATGIVAMLYDSASDTLFGKTFCCPAGLVKVDPGTGVETVVAPSLGLGPGLTLDSATHTVYMTADQFDVTGFTQLIQSINDQTGASSFSTGSISSATYVGALAFEGVAITPESIKTDVRNAATSGAISNGGVATSLLAELTQAQAARSRGQCGVAANLYRAFINEVTAQSGKAIALATATQLISEAQFLIAHCP